MTTENATQNVNDPIENVKQKRLSPEEEEALQKQVEWSLHKLKQRISRACEGNRVDVCMFALADIFYQTLSEQTDPLVAARNILALIHAQKNAEKAKIAPKTETVAEVSVSLSADVAVSE